MDPYDERAVATLRKLSNQLVEGNLSFEEFYDAFCRTAHCLLDADQSSMPESLAEEVEFYLRWEGFGPREGHIPRNTHWQYGSAEKFGWIDKEAFAKKFAEEFARFVPDL